MTSKNLFFKLMREDWEKPPLAPALIALQAFSLIRFFWLLWQERLTGTGIQLRKPSTGFRNSP